MKHAFDFERSSQSGNISSVDTEQAGDLARRQAVMSGGPVGEMHSALSLALDPAGTAAYLQPTPLERAVEGFSRIAGLGLFTLSLAGIAYLVGAAIL